MQSLFIPIVLTMLQLIAMMAVGFIAKRLRLLPQEFFSSVSIFLVRLALPIYLFSKILESDPEVLTSSWIFPLAAIIISGVGILLATPVFAILPFHGKQQRAGVALSSFGNSAYIPLAMIELFPLTLPMVAERFGTSAPALFVGSYVLIFSPLLWSVGNYLVTAQRGFSFRNLINPPLIGIILGFIGIASGAAGPLLDEQLFVHHVYAGIKQIGLTTLPLILFSLGGMIADIDLHPRNRSSMVRMALGVASVRFILLPAFFWAAYFLFLRRIPMLTDTHIWVLFLETHLPPATNLSVMTNRAGINRGYTAFTLLITYLGYVLIFPFFMMLFLLMFPGG
jgi:hypothetical protein